MLNADVLKEFIFDCKMRKLSDRTIKSYQNNNLALFHFIKDEYSITELEEINNLHVKGYIQYLTDKKLSEIYINTIVRTFRSYFRYAVEEHYILKNPIDKIKKQKEPIIIINTFTNDEVKRMIQFYRGSKFLDMRNQLIMIILFDTGIRCSELCGLKLSDVRDTYINIMGKGKKIRHVPITAIINKYLVRYLRVRENYIKDKINYNEEFLFLSQKGKQLTVETIERVVLECGNNSKVRNEIRTSPHTCRHYYAQTQLKNGCDLFTVSKLLGHTNINVTKRYLQSMHDDDTLIMGAKTSPLMNL
jgi:integrase/recombinase XerD